MAHKQEKYFYAEKPGPMKLGESGNVTDVSRPANGNEVKVGPSGGATEGPMASRPGGYEDMSDSGEGSENPFARPGGSQQIK